MTNTDGKMRFLIVSLLGMTGTVVALKEGELGMGGAVKGSGPAGAPVGRGRRRGARIADIAEIERFVSATIQNKRPGATRFTRASVGDNGQAGKDGWGRARRAGRTPDKLTAGGTGH